MTPCQEFGAMNFAREPGPEIAPGRNGRKTRDGEAQKASFLPAPYSPARLIARSFQTPSRASAVATLADDQKTRFPLWTSLGP